MKPIQIAYYSDLHLEYSSISLKSTHSDVIVVAGDLWAGEPEKGIFWMQEQFPEKPVLFVPGNHDFEFVPRIEAIQRFKKVAQGTNVHVLCEEVWNYQGIRFLGTPFYSAFDLHGDTLKQVEKTMQACQAYLPVGDYWEKEYGDVFDMHQCRHLALESRAWLTQELAKAQLEQQETVVITHWAPSPQCLHPRFLEKPNNAYWANPCDDMVKQTQLWIHGHTHDTHQHHLGNNPYRGHICCNPRSVCSSNELAQPYFEWNPSVCVWRADQIRNLQIHHQTIHQKNQKQEI